MARSNIRYSLVALVAIATLLVGFSSPVQGMSISVVSKTNNNSSSPSPSFGQLFPSLRRSSFLDLGKWFQGISSFFPQNRFSSFPRIEDKNGTKIWTMTLDVNGFDSSNLNASRKGMSLQVIGRQTNERNQTREIVFEQTLPLNGQLNELKIVLKEHKLTITLPIKETKLVQIPIQLDSDLKYKPSVKVN